MGKQIWGVLALSMMVSPVSPVSSLSAQLNRSRALQIKDGEDVEGFRESWRALDPVTRRNLSVYPVVSNLKVQTSGFLTLDEGVASGEVRILERGQVENALYRRRDSRRWPPGPETPPPSGSASVNELVLVNDSSRPLILLAGEVVSGGKQNRIIGADLVVPPKSAPLPLTVFCVEHGRWSEGSAFGSAKAIAHPSIRMEAQASKSQQGVWDSVARSAAVAGAASPTSSYVDVLQSPKASREMAEAASAIASDYERELREQLRGRNAVGVIVAINGELVWSDVFPSQELFEKYWPKLLRSYVMEADGHPLGTKSVPSPKEAQSFLLEDRGHVSVRLEPGAYRLTEIAAANYQVDALEAIGRFADAGIMVHYNKMSHEQPVGLYRPAPAPKFHGVR